jgi:hypothetical protein
MAGEVRADRAAALPLGEVLAHPLGPLREHLEDVPGVREHDLEYAVEKLERH